MYEIQPAQKTLRVATVSSILDVPKATVYRWIQSGLLAASRVGKVVMIPVDEVERLLRENRTQPRTLKAEPPRALSSETDRR